MDRVQPRTLHEESHWACLFGDLQGVDCLRVRSACLNYGLGIWPKCVFLDLKYTLH